MARTPSSPWLRWAQARRRAAHADFGDYGTAFGMELTLRDDPAQAAEPASPPPSRGQPAWAGWLGRWMSRRA